MATTCNICNNFGYLGSNCIEYCDCNAGLFYEQRDELSLQIALGFLDVGQDDDTTGYDIYDSDDSTDYEYNDSDDLDLIYYSEHISNIYNFSHLPFYIGYANFMY